MSAGRILFIEDQFDTLKGYLKLFKKCSLVSDDEYQKISRFKGDNQIEKFENFNSVLEPRIEAATCFVDAFEKIKSAKTGSEYDWFFIDRNLFNYDDISNLYEKGDEICFYKNFSREFFDGFGFSDGDDKKIFVGDYLIVVLINAGVPIEKICFLTANNDSSIENLLKSPFLHGEKLPKVIDKEGQDLEEILREESPCSKIRFLYRNIFKNEKVNIVFGSYIEQFISVLAKRYKNGMDATYDQKGDGILFRNMIEAVVGDISKNPNIAVREYLNFSDAYSKLFNTQYTVRNYNNLKNDLGYPPTRKDKEAITKFLKDKKVYGKKLEQETNDIIRYSTATVIGSLKKFYCDKKGAIPKYILSYIDNIYTVTSEFSAHGQNDTTTDGLSVDGWSALLSGMIQIMQWVANTNPNPTSSAN